MKKLLLSLFTLLTVYTATAQCTASFTQTNVGGGTVNFTSTSIGTTSNTGYYWNFGDGNNFYAMNNIFASHTYSNNQTYTVSLWILDSIGGNCTSNISQTLAVSNASCTTSVNFSMYKDSTQLPAIVWDAYPTYPQNITAANWTWGDGTSTVSLYPSHTYSAAGMYSICVSITVSCGATATACYNTNIYKSGDMSQFAMATVHVLSGITGIKKVAAEEAEVRLYPNPNNGDFEISLKNYTSRVELEIYSVLGKKIYSNIVEENLSAKKVKVIDVAEGSYFLKINSAGKTSYKKFVVVK